VTDYLCAKYSDLSFSGFGLTCGQTDRQTEAHDCYTHATTVGLSNYNVTLVLHIVGYIIRSFEEISAFENPD